MNRFVLMILAVLLSVHVAFSKKVTVAGNWLLTIIETNGNQKDVYAPVTFQPNGDFVTIGMKVGTWKLQKKTVHIAYEQFKAANGDNKVLKLNKEEMILENTGIKMYFLRMDKEKISLENKNSGLMGAWKITSDDPQVIRFINFSASDSFTYVEKEPGVTTSGSGTWIFNNKDNTLFLVARIEGLEKKYEVKNFTPDNFSMVNRGKKMKAIKKQVVGNLEHLDFKPDDFYDSDGNFKYDKDEEKLPWKEPYAMIKHLQSIHQLTYTYSSLVKDVNVFQTKTLMAGVKADENEGRACIDFIFYGYDKNHLPYDTQLPPNCYSYDSYNKLFPEKEADFRILGKEQLTTPAGTFNCTVVEAVGDSDQKFKMWMIDDKPGVYAKIIEEDPDESFGYYHVYELQAIK